MVMVHKFQQPDQSLPLKVAEALGTYHAIPSGQPFGVVNDSSRIVLMIDEAHRTQSSDLGDNIFAAFPNAARHCLCRLIISPKVPPVELLSTDFIAQLHQHAGGNTEAKASEMEHAVRKHCTVHNDEDPAFYQSLSQKVENLIDQYQDQWERLAEELEKLRTEAIAGRQQGIDGMGKEATTFYEHIANQAFANGEVPPEDKPKLKALMEAIVETLQDSIGSVDFWNNSDK